MLIKEMFGWKREEHFVSYHFLDINSSPLNNSEKLIFIKYNNIRIYYKITFDN
jgi:hypothetical protein